MTILRAAARQPGRFAAVGFCNMPFEAATPRQKRTFGLQHAALLFRDFYTRQAAKALYGKSTLARNPALHSRLSMPMGRLSTRQIRLTDRFVILEAEDATELLEQLKVPALALKGEEDYVPAPPRLQTTRVAGGHVSPLENPEAVLAFCQRVLRLAPSPNAGRSPLPAGTAATQHAYSIYR